MTARILPFRRPLGPTPPHIERKDEHIYSPLLDPIRIQIEEEKAWAGKRRKEAAEVLRSMPLESHVMLVGIGEDSGA